MALWLVRVGKHGEHENKFLTENCIFFTWDGLCRDLSSLTTHQDFQAVLREYFPTSSAAKIRTHAAQARAFVAQMSKGDWCIVPSKLKPVLHVAELTGGYKFNSKADNPYYHSRTVKWIAKDVPRLNFDQDLLSAFNAMQTICGLKNNDAERRVRDMAANDWKSGPSKLSSSGVQEEEPVDSEEVDLEQSALDTIAALIKRKMKGHGLARLVDGILRAQGYTTYLSPPGPDKGIDILAAPGPLGFGNPRLCVQVKSGDGPVDSPTLVQLIGAMKTVDAQQGLLVSWGGFKHTVEKELPSQFFQVRFWGQADIIEQLLLHYDALDDDLRTEIPLKRIWIVATDETEE